MGTMAFAGALPVLRNAWHMDAATAGSIQTAFNLANAVALLVAAWLCDSFGARRVYLVSTWAGAVALGFFAMFARSPHTALISIVLVGLTQGGSYAPALILASELSPPSRRGSAIGMMLAAGSLGYLLSLFFALWGTQTFGVAAGFGVCALGVVMGASAGHICLTGASPSEREQTARPRARPESLSWRGMFTPVALCLLVGYVAHCWELLGHYAWTPSLLAHAVAPLKLSAPWAALLIGAVIHLSGMVSTAVIGVVSDRWGRSKVLIWVAAAGALCSVLMGYATQWGPAWTIFIAMMGSFFILGDSGVLSAAMTDEVSPCHIGRVMGVRSVVGFGAGALAPTAFGAVYDVTHEWTLPYATLAIGGICACVAAILLNQLIVRSRLPIRPFESGNA
nr:MFS transporter [Caballeronia calidae]